MSPEILPAVAAAAVAALVPAVGAFAGGWVAGSRRVKKLQRKVDDIERRLVDLVESALRRHELSCVSHRPSGPEVTPALGYPLPRSNRP